MDILYGMLHKIINMGITGTIAILAVLFIRMFLCRAPKKYSYMLWGIVLFRLLCPVSLPSVFSVLNFADVEVKGNGEVTYLPKSIFYGQGGLGLATGQNVSTQHVPEEEKEGLIKEKQEKALDMAPVEEVTGVSGKLGAGQGNLLFLGAPSAVWFAAWLIGAGLLAVSRLLAGLRLSR